MFEFFVNKLILFQTCPPAAISKKIYLIVHISARQTKTAVTSWRAVNVALTLASSSVSVKKDTMGKDCNMSVRVSLMSRYLGFSVYSENMANLSEICKRSVWDYGFEPGSECVQGCWKTLWLKTQYSSSSQMHFIPCLQQ